MSRPIALQLYTVRHQLLVDLPGTLERICRVGFREVETYPFPPDISVVEVAKVLKSLQVNVIAMHTALPGASTADEIQRSVDALECQRIVWHGWPKPEEYNSLSGLRQLADRYQEAYSFATGKGWSLGLHNHWWEFEPVEGQLPWRLLHTLLQPGLFFEIDAYWARTAGFDPASIIAEFRSRVRLLHIKNGPAVHGEPMTAVNEGVLRFDEVLKGAPADIPWIVELDECATDIFEVLDRSHRYLKKLA